MADGEVKATRQRELLVIGDELASKNVRLAAAATQMRTLIESGIFNRALRQLGGQFKNTDNPEDLEQVLDDWGLLFSRLSNLRKIKKAAVDQLRGEIGDVLNFFGLKIKRASSNMHGLSSILPPLPRRIGILGRMAQMKAEPNNSSETPFNPQPEAQEINPEGNVVASNVESADDGALRPDASPAPSDANLVVPVEEASEIKSPEIAAETSSNSNNEGSIEPATERPEAQTEIAGTPQEPNTSENHPELEAEPATSPDTTDKTEESPSESPTKNPSSKKPPRKKRKEKGGKESEDDGNKNRPYNDTLSPHLTF